jgi:hypothetical protein
MFSDEREKKTRVLTASDQFLLHETQMPLARMRASHYAHEASVHFIIVLSHAHI